MSLTHMHLRNPLNAIKALEQLLETIKIKYDEHEQALQDIWDENHVVIDGSNLEMLNYHEGAIEVLSLIEFQGQELMKLVTISWNVNGGLGKDLQAYY